MSYIACVQVNLYIFRYDQETKKIEDRKYYFVEVSCQSADVKVEVAQDRIANIAQSFSPYLKLPTL